MPNTAVRNDNVCLNNPKNSSNKKLMFFFTQISKNIISVIVYVMALFKI